MINQLYPNITPQRWADIQALFSQKTGVAITGDSGTAQDRGIHFSWAYGGDQLAVTVISVPWYLPVNEADVVNQFTTWVNSVQ
jgi:hypothetical protein